MKPKSEPAAPRKPRLALLIATGFGLGNLPLAPGTWGSIGGLALTLGVAAPYFRQMRVDQSNLGFWERLSIGFSKMALFDYEMFLLILVALVGIFTAGRAARYLENRDPQCVVIDEMSGIVITILLGIGIATPRGGADLHVLSIPISLWNDLLNWKYLLLGFILFRAFDIWKPFPARRAERLPGGWGIMADDWVAGIYAALGLWVARALGL